MSNAYDERDFAEEAAYEALLREDGELGDYEIDPDAIRRQAQDAMAGHPGSTPAVPAQRNDADLVADAMKALEGQILAIVPADQRNKAQDLVSCLLDLAPGQALGLTDTHELARAVLTPQRTLEDWAINQYARFYPYSAPADESGDTGYPCIELGGDDNGAGGVQVYAYAEDGSLVISLHFDSAGPDETGRGPWAYYGRDNAIPVTVLGGNGKPVYVAAEGVPDLSDALAADAHAALAAYFAVTITGDNLAEEGEHAQALADALAALLAVTGRPAAPYSGAEGGSGAEGRSG
jgi:hypothetical protein